MIKFSIIMPSYLGDYSGAAKQREYKIIRAIESVVTQSWTNWELIIVADGCQKTIDVVMEHCLKFEYPYDIRLLKVKKQTRWSGIRNVGLDAATGDYVVYLDIDDMFAAEYLTEIAEEVKDGMDWYFTDDYQFFGNGFQRNNTNIKRIGQCGTSNIIHKVGMNSRWLRSDYTEDWQFIRQLKAESKKCRRINACGYYICHLPNITGKGYDL